MQKKAEAGHCELLTVAGHITGRPRPAPVRPVRCGGQRWLVAPYAPVSPVKNARDVGQVTRGRGRRRQTFKITEAGPADNAAVLREHARVAPAARPYFTARPHNPASRFAEAAGHPVFRLIENGHSDGRRPGPTPARADSRTDSRTGHLPGTPRRSQVRPPIPQGATAHSRSRL